MERLGRVVLGEGLERSALLGFSAKREWFRYMGQPWR
jgi:hypothetical protein